MCDTPGLHKTGYLFDRDAEMIAAVINAVTNEHITAPEHSSVLHHRKEIYILVKKKVRKCEGCVEIYFTRYIHEVEKMMRKLQKCGIADYKI